MNAEELLLCIEAQWEDCLEEYIDEYQTGFFARRTAALEGV